MRAERAVGSRGGAGDRNLGGGGGGGRGHPGRPHEHKRTHECAFARGSTAAISWRESLSFHLRAHAMCAMEGWEHNARWAECRMGCENRSAQPLLHPPPPAPGSYKAAQSTISVEPTLLSLNGAHHTKCEQPRWGCIGHYSPLRSWRPNTQSMDRGSLAV